MIELVDKKDVYKGKLIEHHTKYKEIHGKDETIFISHGEHIRLHRRLRREGKCNIPPKELEKISNRAGWRTEKFINRRRKKCKTGNTYDKCYKCKNLDKCIKIILSEKEG